MSTTHDTIQDLYLAYYQRPGDPYGLVYWCEQYDAGVPFAELQTSFGSSVESLNLYGVINSSTIGGVIDKIYWGLFNRAPDAPGKQWYTDEYNSGRMSAAAIAYSVLIGAQGQDAVTVATKRALADFMSRQQVSQNCAWVQITPEESGAVRDQCGEVVSQYNNFYTVGGSGGLGLSERPDAFCPIGYVYTDHGDVQLPDFDQAADKRIAILAKQQERPVPPPLAVHL